MDQQDEQDLDSNIMSESQYKNQIISKTQQIQESEIDLSVIEESENSLQDLVSDFFMDIENNDKILEIRSQAKQYEEEYLDFKDQFIIRQYQMEMYEKAKNKNSIIYLETGLGKTLILIMMMWYKLQCQPDKKVIFLANTINLVEQQTAQIKQKLVRVADMLGDSEEDIQTAIELIKQVQAIHGSKYTESWNITMWKLLLERNQIFVMTSQLFLNCLRQGIVKLSQFSLVIMDECHSASGSHQYNDIMNEFYFPLKTKLVEARKLSEMPQIIGATASPVVQKKNTCGGLLIQHLMRLAAILDSYYIYQDKRSIGKYMNSAQISYLEYDCLLDDQELQSMIDQNHPSASILKCKNKQFQDKIVKSRYIDEYFTLKKIIHELNSKYFNIPQILIVLKQIYRFLIERGFHIYMDIGPIVIVYCLEYTDQQIQSFIDAEPGFEYISQIQYIQSQLKNRYSFIKNYKDSIIDTVSPKVKQLLLFLQNTYKSKSKKTPMGLIFVKSRATAKYLNMVIQDYFKQSRISTQTDFIIGHRVPQRNNKAKKPDLCYSISKDCHDESLMIKSLIEELMKNHTQYFQNYTTENVKKLLIFRNAIDYNQQIKKIQSFKDGTIQLLIATSVAEEGIDLPSCNYVIGFTSIQSSKALVQMKGRARQQDSQFIALISKTSASKLRMDCMTEVLSQTQEVIAKLSNMPDDIFQLKLAQLQNQMKTDKYYECYYIESTGACINTDWSQHLIHLFCQSIATPDHVRGTPKFINFILKNDEEQEKKYVCFVQIPLQLKQFIFCGSLQKDQKDAKNSACFKAITTLIGQGYIDEYLRPSFTNDVGLQLGADEDDSSIQLTREQILIIEQYTKKQQQSYNLNQIGIISAKRLYKQNTQFYCSQQKMKKTSYFKCTLTFDNQLIYLYTSGPYLTQIRDSSEMLSIQKLDLTTIEIIEYSEYCQIYHLYEQCIFQEIESIDLRENYYFKDIEYNDIMFLYNSQYNGKYLELYQIIQKSIKAQNFHKKIANFKLTNTIVTDKQESTMPKLRNLILENIDQYTQYLKVNILQKSFQSEILNTSQSDDSLFFLNSEKSNVDTKEQLSQNTEQITQMHPQKMPLNQIILSSLSNQYEFKNLFIGSSYFKLMLSIQLFSANLEQNTKIIEIRQKTYQSATFVRNQLLEIKLFENLHIQNQNLSQIYSGLIKINKEESEDYVQYAHLSNQTFLQFLQQSCYLIQQFDEKMVIGFEWLKQLGITNQILSTISSTDHLKNHLNTATKTNDYVQQLKQNYQGLEQQLNYQFNCFEILFRSMVDESVQYNYNLIKQQNATKKLINPNYSDCYLNELSFNYGDIDFNEQFDTFQTYDVENYGNAQLGQLGKKIWNHLISKFVVNLELNAIQIIIAKKNLKNLQFLTALSVKLNLNQYFNFSQTTNEVRQNYDKLSKQKDLPIEQLTNLIDNNDSTKILANCFYALIAAIFLDSNCDMVNINELCIKLIESVNGQIMCSIDQMLLQPKYLFLRWYENNFGNAINFDLIKIPYLDYHKMARGFSLYLPYDVINSQIGINNIVQLVNVLKDKLINVAQLHIYATSKVQAWDLLLKIVYMN